MFFEPGALIDTDATLIRAGGTCKGYYFHTAFPQFIVEHAHIIAHLKIVGIYCGPQSMATSSQQHQICGPFGQHGGSLSHQHGQVQRPIY